MSDDTTPRLHGSPTGEREARRFFVHSVIERARSGVPRKVCGALRQGLCGTNPSRLVVFRFAGGGTRGTVFGVFLSLCLRKRCFSIFLSVWVIEKTEEMCSALGEPVAQDVELKAAVGRIPGVFSRERKDSAKRCGSNASVSGLLFPKPPRGNNRIRRDLFERTAPSIVNACSVNLQRNRHDCTPNRPSLHRRFARTCGHGRQRFRRPPRRHPAGRRRRVHP